MYFMFDFLAYNSYLLVCCCIHHIHLFRGGEKTNKRLKWFCTFFYFSKKGVNKWLWWIWRRGEGCTVVSGTRPPVYLAPNPQKKNRYESTTISIVSAISTFSGGLRKQIKRLKWFCTFFYFSKKGVISGYGGYGEEVEALSYLALASLCIRHQTHKKKIGYECTTVSIVSTISTFSGGLRKQIKRLKWFCTFFYFSKKGVNIWIWWIWRGGEGEEVRARR